MYETLTIKERPVFTTMTNATVQSSDSTIDDIAKTMSASKIPAPPININKPALIKPDPNDPMGLPY